MHGAKVIALQGNFDQALEIVRELADHHPIGLVNSVNPFRLEGQKTASFEILEVLGDLDALCIPVGNAGNITAYWKGFQEAGASPRMLGYQASGAAPLVHRPARRAAGDGRERHPDRQPRPLGGGDERDDGVLRDGARGHRRADPRRLPLPGRPRGRVLRAGLGGRGRRPARQRRRGRGEDRLRAHRARPQGPADGPVAGRRRRAVRGAGLRRGGASSSHEPPARRPGAGVLGEPRPGLRRAGRGARRCTSRSRWWRPAASASAPTCASPATGATSACAGSPGSTTRRASSSASPPTCRSAAAWGRARRRTSPASWPPTRCSSSTRTCWRWPRSSRATRTTSRRRCTAASSSCVAGRVTRIGVPPELEAVLVVPHEAVRTRQARAALPARVPMADAVHNVGHVVAARARPRARRPVPGGPRPGGPAAPAAPRPPVPAVRGARRRRGVAGSARRDGVRGRADRAGLDAPVRDRPRRRRPCASAAPAGRTSCACRSRPRAPTCSRSEPCLSGGSSRASRAGRSA